MLYSLASFETDAGQAGMLSLDVKRALWNVMVTSCETRRLRDILVEMNSRMQNNTPPKPLSEPHMNLIHCWASCCSEVLRRRVQGNLGLDSPLPYWISGHHNLPTMGSLIGIYGQLMMIKLDSEELGITTSEFDLHWRSEEFGAGNVQEPGIEMHF